MVFFGRLEGGTGGLAYKGAGLQGCQVKDCHFSQDLYGLH